MIESFGKTKDGEEVVKITIDDSMGNTLSMLNYGATIQSLVIDGTDIVLGYDTIKEYEENSGHLGATIGRCANRISHASFILDGKEYPLYANDKTNSLHGGKKGFDKQLWNYHVADNQITFLYHSPDGEEGYPGNLTVCVTYIFKFGKLGIHYDAYSDKKTLINLTNHTYFNLNGQGTVLNHDLMVASDVITLPNDDFVPCGETMALKGTPLDFRDTKKIKEAVFEDLDTIKKALGIDHNFYLGSSDGKIRPIASLYSEDSRLLMNISSDMDTVCVYAGCQLTGQHGKSGRTHPQYGGICFETQYMTNAINMDNFKKPIFDAGEHFISHTIFTFVKR